MDGIEVAIPRDVALILESLGDATIERDPRRCGLEGFYVRYPRRSWCC